MYRKERDYTEVSIPLSEEHMATVAGHLNRIGAWLKGTETRDGVIYMTARVPTDEFVGFRAWLKKTTGTDVVVEA